ncbi:unconventional myosin-VI-like [Centruroides sculpturatus]|uniref:unconventional myosin-VI-like n=1 Tax=Centruroides sculpturatus TaxID=218467 RepID=UPI000C6E63D0|nr:unconventional myosin-VI-like [Centruroides sculpturatus]
MKSDPENLSMLVNRVKKWLLASRWKKAQWCALSAIKLKNKILYRRANLIIIQKTVKMHLAKRKYRPRFLAIMKIKALREQLKNMSTIINQLKKDKQQSEAQVRNLEFQMNDLINTIKVFNFIIKIISVNLQQFIT